MKRIYEDAAYAPLKGCWWSDTVPNLDWPVLTGDKRTDVAIIGGGFTGLSAALHLAQDGVDVTVLEAETPAFGASGRNGGFCCLGGAMAPRKHLLRVFGPEGLAEWRNAELAAVNTVGDLVDAHSMDVDRHSDGETVLAHSPKAMAALRALQTEITADYGLSPKLYEQSELASQGLSGPFHGAMTNPVGFALNPQKYHRGLAQAATKAGATLHAHTAVHGLGRSKGVWRLRTHQGTVTADQVIIATNGYSSESVPQWLRARYLPVQSSVLVTRPLTQTELETQGWTSDQMAYDSRMLLHYFRKLPDNRFLFGARGGLRATPSAEAKTMRALVADFHAMFPAWRDVDITHRWQGLVCLMPDLTPFCGPVPKQPGVFAGLGYHGNGVAMSSYTGVILADLAQGRSPRVPHPIVMRKIPKRMALGRYRRLALGLTYAIASLVDR